MPRGDQTGPSGQGPATGRGMGYCTGFNSPGFTKGAPRGGGGLGRGSGRGRGGFGRQSAYNPRGILRPRYVGRAPVANVASNVPSSQLNTGQQEYQELESRIGDLEERLEGMQDTIEELLD